MEKRCDNCLFKSLSSNFLSNDEYELIRRTSVQLTFKKNEIIFKQGSKFTHLFSKGYLKFDSLI